jgi:hypothetical protein
LTGADSFATCSRGELRDFKVEVGKGDMKYPFATSILMQVTHYLCMCLLRSFNSACAARAAESAVICALQNDKIRTVSRIVCS